MYIGDGSIKAPQRYSSINPTTCIFYVTLHGKGDFAEMMKVKELKIERVSREYNPVTWVLAGVREKYDYRRIDDS